MKKLIYLLTLVALILVLIPFTLAHVEADSNSYKAQQAQERVAFGKEPISQVKGQATEQKELSDEQVITITNQFMDHLIQETESDYEVKNYQSLEEYKSSFKDLASKNVVDQFVDYYYEERGQALYIKPTETPAWLIPDNDFNTERLSDDTFRVTQTNDIELYGKYRVIFDIKLNENDEPYIINVQYQ
ncbi:hypothetical protein [Aquisalibacillus elongatus]|uniref:Uncharacterized protein n=1 Tax=Aquisalibacillus elongatus TaxID=485577 RepID=A0A3N5BWM2_9BACI|nr:hypothetical protein [Aquisalibacillus elongatus]RPF50275.1 hypothetical protein EDC24_2710 [Aquisalibacillus elongatus]